MIKRNGVFTPAYDSDYEKAKKLKDGEYEFKISLIRNPQFHRRYFAMLNCALNNQDTFDSLEDFRCYVIMKAGWYNTIKTDNGYMYIPKSISFEKMDEAEFQDLHSKSLDVIIRFLQVTEKDFNDNLIDFM